MIKITKKLGIWRDGKDPVLLYYEKCPNPSCSNIILHYPVYTDGPHCPDCKAGLIGSELEYTLRFRTKYHLESGVSAI